MVAYFLGYNIEKEIVFMTTRPHSREKRVKEVSIKVVKKEIDRKERNVNPDALKVLKGIASLIKK